MKKLAILLASVFVTSICVANASLLAPAAMNDSSFTDVNDYTSYYNSIKWMENNKIVSGYEDGSFGGDKCVTRAEFLKIMYKVQDIDTSPVTTTEPLFKDVQSDSWYAPYVQIAKNKGSINGYEDGTFHPDQCISRAEAVKIASLEFNNNTIPQDSDETLFYYNSASSYSDIPSNDWYYMYMDYALKANTLGTDHTLSTYDFDSGTNKFAPNEPMTRKEAAEMFFRFKAMKDNEKSQYDYFDEPKIKTEDLFYNNCTDDSSATSKIDTNILNAIPKDASLVMGLDHSNDTQLKNVEKILGTITKQDFWKELSEESKELSLVMDTDWSAVMSVTTTSPTDENPKVVLVGKFDNTDKFENLFAEMVAEEMNYSTTCKKLKGITYWTSVDEQFYYARYGNILIATNEDVLRSDAIKNLKNESGFSFSNNLDKDKLAYIYVNENLLEMAKTELESDADSIYLNELIETLGSIGNVYGYISSDSDGFFLSTEAEIKNPNNKLIKKYINTNPVLVDQVPGKNTLLYAEDIDLGMVLEMPNPMSYSSEEPTDVLTEISSEIGVSNTEMKSLLSSSYAISMSDNGSVLPSVSFYLKFNPEDRATADKTVQAIDKWIEEGIQNAGSIGDDIYLKDVISKTTTSRGLTKITLDVNKLPADLDNDMEVKTSLQEAGVELYYGILNNNTLVVALYPNFESYYESSPISKDYTFIEAKNRLEGVYGSKLTFIDISNIVSYVTNVMDITNNYSSSMPSEKELDAVKEIIGTFKYFISSTKASETSVKANAFLKVEN